MHYVNNRVLASAPNERHFVLSATTVKCCDYLPALTDCGRFVTGDPKLRLECFDHLPPARLVVEVSSHTDATDQILRRAMRKRLHKKEVPSSGGFKVERREGVLQPVFEPAVDTTGAELDWMTCIRPARDRHEQNVEVVLDYRSGGGGLRLRTSRVVKPGDELLVWYGDQLALDLGVPVLTPANIRGHAQYICSECSTCFQSPNPLKSHMMYSCASPYRCTPPIVDHAYSSWHSMLPLLLPSVTSSLPPTNYFRLIVGSPPSQSKVGGSQVLYDTKVQGRCKGQGHISSLLFSPVTSSPPLTNYFRLPAGSSTCPTSESGMLRGAEVEGRGQGKGKVQGNCWRPVCLDEDRSAHNKLDFNCRSSPTDKIVSYGCRSMTRSTPSSESNGQTAVDLERIEATATRSDGASVGRKRRASVAVATDAETGSRSVTSSSRLEGRHECAYCGKRYSRRYGLTIHVRTHTGHKPLQCAVCLRPFGDPSNLNKHVRLHAGDADTPYRCRHCGKVLVRRRDLERHVRSRHPDTINTPSPLQA